MAVELEEAGGVDGKVKGGRLRQVFNELDELGAGLSFNNKLPSVAAISSFVERGGGLTELERGVSLTNGLVKIFDVFEGGGFGFVGDGDFQYEGEGWQLGASTIF